MTSAPRVTRLDAEDLVATREILSLSGLVVDLEAELARQFSLPWLLKTSENERPVAFLLAWSVADELHLLDMACHPEHRRRGYARALLGALLAFAREQHKRLILLEVRRSNGAAISLYESAGFEISNVRPRYYADNGEDALEMRVTLDTDTGEIAPEGS